MKLGYFQVPAKWSYLSDGRYITYSFDGIELEFKKRSNAEISNMSLTTAMVIQALRTIGKKMITTNQIILLRKILSSEDKRKLMSEGKTASAWIYEELRKIVQIDNESERI